MRALPLVLGFAVSALIACGDRGDSGSGQDLANPSVGKVAGRDAGTGAGGVVGDVASTEASAPAAVRFEGPSPAAPPAPPRGAPSEPSAELPTTQGIMPSMVIRTGDARIEVDSLEIALARLHALATQLGGFIGNTSMQAGEREVRQAMVELKMPADRFEAARSGLSGIGKVEYVNVQAQDVSEEYVDVEARVENARRLESRLVSLLATRTGRLEEVLSVERELARIRETIERYEGRLRYLRTRAAVSTLMITIHEKSPLVGQLGTGNRIVEAFRTAWRNFVGFLALIIESLGVLVPLAILAAIVVFFWQRRPRRPEPPAPPPTGTSPRV